MQPKIFEDVNAMQALVDVLPVAIFVKDAASRFQVMNKACEAQWGMAFSSLCGNDAGQFFPPEQMALFLAKDREVFEGGVQVEFEEIFWNAALKQNRIGHTFKKPIYDNDGRPLYLVCITIDITDSKEAEARHERGEARLRAIFENEPECIKVLDAFGKLREMNPAGLAMIEADSLEQVVGQALLTLIVPECRAAFAEMHKKVMGGEDGVLQFEVVGLKGRRSWLETHAVPMQDGGETVMLAVTRDITEHKQAEDALRYSEQRFRDVSEAAGEYLWETDANLVYTYVSRRSVEVKGYTPEELLGHTPVEFMPPGDFQPDVVARAIANKTPFRVEHRDITKSGEIMWEEVNGVPFCDDRGVVIGLRGTGLNITERKLAEDKSKLAALVYESSSEGMMVTDGENRILDINPAFTRTTGYTLEEVRGKTPSFLNSGRQDAAFYSAMLHAIKSGGSWQGEMWNRRKNGEIYVEWQTINAIFNADGSVHRHVALFSDITQKKATEELIWRQANFDSLTGLPNRRMFHDRLEQELKKSARSGLPLALMFIDLDHFKEVNDTLGHDQGDYLLIEAARRIADCVRSSDTVARLGGDEFTVILPALEDTDSVERIAQAIIDSLMRSFMLCNENVFISASIGITLYPGDADEIETLLKNADQAMYVAKNAGRNRFSYFTQALQDAAQTRMRLTSDLRGALEAEQFRVYYQPIVEMATGEIHKAEALIRWQHPERGMVSPVQFIPLAEESGLINQIGDWVFQETARQVKHWRATHAPLFQISVNKSPVQFRQNNIDSESSWLAQLAALSLHGQSISVEITEGLLLNAEGDVQNKLFALRDAGVQVSIDDFGTGYSSLAYLKKFDIDYLKIDQSFVSNLENDTDDLALCEAIIVMAHKLGLKVIAEGVETEKQRDILARAGCDYAQGFLFSKALPAEEFEALLVRSRAESLLSPP
jgi:diguanylate cyclase (GGDEF)-like protein/PAS domain S-box-containing protein